MLRHLKNCLAFAVAGGLARTVQVLSLFFKNEAILWAVAIIILFMSYFQWQEIVIKQKQFTKRLLSLLFIIFILSLLIVPTPLQYFYTDAVLWGSVAALLFNIIDGQSHLNFNLGKWILAMLVPWGATGFVGEIFTQNYYWNFIEFPNGVRLNYSFYFLASSFSIFAIYLLYKVRPGFVQGIQFLFRIILGTFLGYIISIPLVYLLLQFSNLEPYQYFIIAVAGRTVCEYFGGGIFASIGLDKMNMRIVSERINPD
jgi:hypothetical protein